MSSTTDRTLIMAFSDALRLVTMALKVERRLPHESLHTFFTAYPKVLKADTAPNTHQEALSLSTATLTPLPKSNDGYKSMLQRAIQLLCLCMSSFPLEMTQLIQEVAMMGMATVQPSTGFPLRNVAGEDSRSANVTPNHINSMSLVDAFKLAMRHVLSAFVIERRMSHRLLYAFYDIYPLIIMHNNSNVNVVVTYHFNDEFRDSRWSHDIIELQRSLHILCECVHVCPEVISKLIPFVSHAMISFEIPEFPLRDVEGEGRLENQARNETNVTVEHDIQSDAKGHERSEAVEASHSHTDTNSLKAVYDAIAPSEDPCMETNKEHETSITLPSDASKSVDKECATSDPKFTSSELGEHDNDKKRKAISSPILDQATNWEARRIPKRKKQLSGEVMRSKMETFHKMISYTPSSANACVEPKDTALCILLESTSTDFYKSKEKEFCAEPELLEFCEIHTVILIHRPAKSEMVYRISDLHRYIHGTVHVGSEQDEWLQDAFNHCNLIDIDESDSTYVNHELGIYVQYGNSSMASSFTAIFPEVAAIMDSSCDPPRNIPFVSCGYSTNDPNKYSSNRVNILGSTKPALIEKGIPKIDPSARVALAQLICELVKTCESYRPGRNNLYFHSDPDIRAIRKDLAHQFWRQLVPELMDVSPSEKDYFRAEGIAVIFNNCVSFHRDKLNDTAKCMNDTISFSMSFPITEQLAQYSAIKKAMSVFGLSVGKRLSVLVACYARKCIADYCKKQLQIKSVIDGTINNSNVPLWLLRPVLERLTNVTCESNTNLLWDDPGPTLRRWRMECTKHINDQYRGNYIKVLAGYDKTQYWSPVKYLADLLHAQHVISWTGTSLMEYIIYVSFYSNGTFLLSGILDEAMSVTDPRYSRFANEVKIHGVLASLLFESYRKRIKPGCCGESLYARHEICKSDTLDFLNSIQVLDEESMENVKNGTSDVATSMLLLLATSWEELNLHIRGDTKSRRRILEQSIHSAGMTIAHGIKRIFKNAKHCHIMNFFELCTMFGYLPAQLCSWGTCLGETSDAYRAINYFHETAFPDRTNTLSVPEANQHMSQVVAWVSKNVNHNFTLRYAEHFISQLCPTDKRQYNGDGERYDILYFYKHRNGGMHHLYRTRMASGNTYTLQMLPIGTDGIYIPGSIITIADQVPGKWNTSKCGMRSFDNHWEIKCTSKYVLSSTLHEFFELPR